MKSTIIFTTALIIVLLTGCSSQPAKSNSASLEQSSSNSSTANDNSATRSDIVITTTPTRVFGWNEIFDVDNLTFQIISATNCKEIGDYSASEFTMLDSEEFDGSKLVGDRSFVFATIEITNNSDEEEAVYLNTIFLRNLDESLTMIGTEELQFLLPSQSDANAKDYFLYTFAPKETQTFVFGYTVNDNFGNDSVYLRFNLTGRPGDSKETKYGKLFS